ncbi:hypothetical protein HY639_03175 [Candidatus Woesearchaeota archaeon]|nr:hypothetical protein [Candidatus Woesearchaeota archaeon]
MKFFSLFVCMLLFAGCAQSVKKVEAPVVQKKITNETMPAPEEQQKEAVPEGPHDIEISPDKELYVIGEKPLLR